MARLVEGYGFEQIASHFIPLNPGPDHQVGLLRHLMARLILKHDLSDLYVASEHRAALRDYFPKVLDELVTKAHEMRNELKARKQEEQKREKEKSTCKTGRNVSP
jgi:hypothetical protein